MPVYSFICACGKTDEIQRPMSSSHKRLRCVCGKLMRRNFVAEAPTRLAACDTYPHASYAMGGHPDDIPDMMETDREVGAPKTSYDSEGDPIFTGKKHRKDYCRAHKVHDRNGGYSDP